MGGAAAASTATDHTTYLGDEPLAITVTTYLLAPIYTQTTPDYVSLGILCDIDLHIEVLDHAGRWVGGWTLGMGAGCDLPRSGTVTATPPPC